MKKKYLYMIGLSLLFMFAACGNDAIDNTIEEVTPQINAANQTITFSTLFGGFENEPNTRTDNRPLGTDVMMSVYINVFNSENDKLVFTGFQRLNNMKGCVDFDVNLVRGQSYVAVSWAHVVRANTDSCYVIPNGNLTKIEQKSSGANGFVSMRYNTWDDGYDAGEAYSDQMPFYFDEEGKVWSDNTDEATAAILSLTLKRPLSVFIYKNMKLYDGAHLVESWQNRYLVYTNPIYTQYNAYTRKLNKDMGAPCRYYSLMVSNGGVDFRDYLLCDNEGISNVVSVMDNGSSYQLYNVDTGFKGINIMHNGYPNYKLTHQNEDGSLSLYKK